MRLASACAMLQAGRRRYRALTTSPPHPHSLGPARRAVPYIGPAGPQVRPPACGRLRATSRRAWRGAPAQLCVPGLGASVRPDAGAPRSLPPVLSPAYPVRRASIRCFFYGSAPKPALSRCTWGAGAAIGVTPAWRKSHWRRRRSLRKPTRLHGNSRPCARCHAAVRRPLDGCCYRCCASSSAATASRSRCVAAATSASLRRRLGSSASSNGRP
jgi:hypothetical protein